jgi:HAD superfamily hydrolase (TIGR01662 family)
MSQIRPRGLLCDYGGTLVEEIEFDTRAGNEMLLGRAAYRPSNVTLEQVMERAHKVSMEVAARRDQFQLETPWPLLTRLIHDFLGIRFEAPLAELEIEFWKASVRTRPMPGAREALEQFHRWGLPIGVVSNCSFAQDVLRYELGKHGLAENLAFVMVSAEYAVRKPSVLLFETAAAKLGLKSDEVWFVGDRLDTDIAGAQAAGMTPVWFGAMNNGGSATPVLTASSWAEIVALFQEL